MSEIGRCCLNFFVELNSHVVTIFDVGLLLWLQYLVYTPLVAEILYSTFISEGVPNPGNNFVMHVLILSAIRHFVGQVMISLSRWPYLTRNYEIQRKGVTFEAVDHSSTW